MTLRARRNPVAERLGTIIARHRRAKGWSVPTLARRADLSDTYLRLLEDGYNVPTITTILHLAIVLGVPPWEMVREATEPFI